jgi:hypothetical protein
MAKVFSYLPALFHTLPGWITGVKKMEGRRAHMYQFMQVCHNLKGNKVILMKSIHQVQQA